MRIKQYAAGFTMVELMIILGVISIMMIIAIPNYLRFRARARQSEAKLALKGIYKAKKTIFSENASYETGFAQFKIEPKNIYTYRAGNQIQPSSSKGSKVTITQAANCPAMEANPTGTTAGGFTINAAGNIDSDGFIDGWYIDNSNCLTNSSCCAGCKNCSKNLNDLFH